MLAGPATDWVDGGAGRDTLSGGDGNDSLHGGAGADRLYAGQGDDTFEGNAGDDLMMGDGGNDTANGGLGSDTIYGGNGDDTLSGGADDDKLDGDYGSNVIMGGEGNDALATMGDGISRLDGGAGDDLLSVWAAYVREGAGIVTANGGDGADIIEFQRQIGNPEVVATGGAGADVFKVQGGEQASFIVTDVDLRMEGDKIDPMANWWITPVVGDVIANGVVSFVQSGADTLVRYDADGRAGTADEAQTVMLLQAVQASDLSSAHLVRPIILAGAHADGELSGSAGVEGAAVEPVPAALVGQPELTWMS